MEYLSITERMLNSDTDAVFRLFDDDENNLVDSLEFLSSFALLSGMTPEEKIRFIFAMYDFDESGVLSLDEMVLAFRSSLSGLTKLSKIDPPTEAEIETIVVLGFDSIRKAGGVTGTENGASANAAGDYKGIDREEFVQYCLNTPEILSWIEFFDDLEEFEFTLSSRQPITTPPILHTDRIDQDEASMNFTLGGFKLLEYERKDRTKIATLGADPHHSIAVYTWRTRERIWSSRTTDKLVHDLRFLSNDTVATCGVDHVYFWLESKPAGIYKRYRGQFGTAVKPETLWCVGVVGRTVFTGSETGMIYVWEGRNLVSGIKGHTGA
eukprot:gene35953-44334_t